MIFPFRNNPKIKTNWFNDKTGKWLREKTKRAYYDMSYKNGVLKIKMREEKKRLGGSAELERHWYGCLEFEINSQFGKDIKMFFDEYLKPEKVKNNRKKRKKSNK
jgi:hypothetical protein